MTLQLVGYIDGAQLLDMVAHDYGRMRFVARKPADGDVALYAESADLEALTPPIVPTRPAVPDVVTAPPVQPPPVVTPGEPVPLDPPDMSINPPDPLPQDAPPFIATPPVEQPQAEPEPEPKE
jgi:hypothetical protein